MYKNRLIALLLLFSYVVVYAKPYITVQMQILPNGRISIVLDTSTQITKKEYKDRNKVADTVKQIWLGKSYTDEHGIRFTYDTNNAGDGGAYEKSLGAISDPDLYAKVIKAQRAFKTHLAIVSKALFKDTIYTAVADISLVNNPYAAANRAIYFEVRKLLNTIGIELPDIDATWMRFFWRRALPVAVFAAGTYLTYKYMPTLGGIGSGVEQFGQRITAFDMWLKTPKAAAPAPGPASE